VKSSFVAAVGYDKAPLFRRTGPDRDRLVGDASPDGSISQQADE
jgi:hypothetical protein